MTDLRTLNAAQLEAVTHYSAQLRDAMSDLTPEQIAPAYVDIVTHIASVSEREFAIRIGRPFSGGDDTEPVEASRV
jgi:hypothetical protein